MLKYIIFCICLILGDQLSKYFVTQNIPLGATIGNNAIIDLTYVRNTGAAWSILDGKRSFFIILALIVVILLFGVMYKNRTKNNFLLNTSLVLCISGAIGNMIDRFWHGYVIDMLQLEFIHFPIFNLADVYLCLGVLLMIIYIFKDGELS